MSQSQRSFRIKLGGLGASVFVRSWMGNLDLQGALYDRTTDPVLAGFQGPLIAVFWHEYLLLPFYLRGRTNTAILTSQHRDAEWLAEAARHMGFRTIRGSTNRGGRKALLKLMRHQGNCNLGIACDGPQGPRRRMAQGPIYLSSKQQVPMITYGIGYDRPWRMPTWDRFAIPRPYSRACMITSPRIQIPAGLDRQGLEHYRQRVEAILQRLSDEAEAWATARTRKLQQIPLRREPAPGPLRIHSSPRHTRKRHTAHSAGSRAA